MIYSRRHPLNAMNRPSFIKKINIQDFLEFPAKNNDPDSCLMLDALRKLPKLKSITTFKPDRAPMRLLTDTCDGIHPVHSPYLRRIDVPALIGVINESIERAGLKESME